jgi:hypothetical protein
LSARSLGGRKNGIFQMSAASAARKTPFLEGLRLRLGKKRRFLTA